MGMERVAEIIASATGTEVRFLDRAAAVKCLQLACGRKILTVAIETVLGLSKYLNRDYLEKA